MKLIVLTDDPIELAIATSRSASPRITTFNPGMPLSALPPEERQALVDGERARARRTSPRP